MQQNDLPNFTMKIKLEEGIFATILAANFPNEKICCSFLFHFQAFKIFLRKCLK